jgi:hypothetical protein
MPNEEVKVIVNVTDDSGTREVVLSYRNVSVLINVSMAPIGNNIFSANITAMPYQTVVEYNYRLRQLQLSRKPRTFLLLHRHTEFSSVIIYAVLIGATLVTTIITKKRKFTFSRLPIA